MRNLISKYKLNNILGQVGQLANRIWYGRQLVAVEIEPIKERLELKQMSNGMPYLVRFVNCPIQFGIELSWLL